MLNIKDKILCRTDAGFILALVESKVTEESVSGERVTIKARCFFTDGTEDVKEVKEADTFKLDDDYSPDSYSIKGWLKRMNEWKIMEDRFADLNALVNQEDSTNEIHN